jgi:GTP pyrophosphokinase
MAIANPTSQQVGSEPDPHNVAKGQPENSDLGSSVEPHPAPPAMAPLAPIAAREESSASRLSGLAADDIRDIDEKFQKLLDTVHLNRPGDDLEIIRKAWALCLQQHEGQKRASGEPYVIHPLEVGQVLAELKMDSTAIAAGLLHDAVEDTDVTSDEIAGRFGEQVAHIVEGVT